MSNKHLYTPLSTYRLQFHRRFTFYDAIKIIPYLSKLGITHCYSSPFLMAHPGSTHGYDICHHNKINPEIGGEEGFHLFSKKLTAYKIGLIVDFVPNHMAADTEANPWWKNVLENGPESPYARFFDIDWEPLKPELKGKVLLPILGDQYGRVLERGELRLLYKNKTVCIKYYDNRFPVRIPAAMKGYTESQWHALNGTPGNPKSFDALHQLLEAQSYRLAYWKTAIDEINYRRFFDVNTLVGLRMEDKRVFHITHKLILRLIQQRKIHGLRIDHIDGLFNPAEYLEQLKKSTPYPIYIVVEKILSGNEKLPHDWKISGTNGYDFLNQVNRLFIDNQNALKIKKNYERLTGRTTPFQIDAHVGKRLIMTTSLSSELHVLANALNQFSEKDRNSRDFTLVSLKNALREVIAHFPIYRTYITHTSVTDTDRQAIAAAIAKAKKRNPAIETSVFEFLRHMLLPEHRDHLSEAKINFAMKVQQYTGPVQAKGLEDTAFYRHNVLVSLNEVGGDPGKFGCTPDEFHQANGFRHVHWPMTMSATSTHDTKRGEDIRARLNVLSEMPDLWNQKIIQWIRFTNAHRTDIDGQLSPDLNDIYLFFQALIGCWPAEPETTAHTRASSSLKERIRDYMLKAIRESKRHTSWINRNEAYENAMIQFVDKTLDSPQTPAFLAMFLPTQKTIARAGRLNSLAQLTLKASSPGVPDFYQGTELWDFSLVDPDNRRLVDYDHRIKLLKELSSLKNISAQLSHISHLLRNAHTGHVKLFLTNRCLQARRKWPDLFLKGRYIPIRLSTQQATAFARAHKGKILLTVVPRLCAQDSTPKNPFPLGKKFWKNEALPLAQELHAAVFHNIITGETIKPEGRGIKQNLPLAKVFNTFPSALLIGTASKKH